MSKTRRPPEILRKSHPHLDSDERAKRKRELLDALDEAGDEDEQDAGIDDNGNKEDFRREAHGRPIAQPDGEDDS
jgi:hypothetical protein